ncbi:hypothetical protein NDU88_008782 [Pleurodeles waltl]|uniref:Uncharacterized protein n=1 Tax=Pleurodeles waltl TaxID=8319 RepID=A0AAV7P620_PLEWA|nr:hypothetical protein NDU88_008782 [Pleurodeles waltl]
MALQHPVLGSVQAWRRWLGYGGYGSAVSRRGTNGLDMADVALQHPVLGSVQAWRRWLGYGGCGSAVSKRGTYGLDMENVALQHPVLGSAKRGTYGLDMENVALQHPVLGSVQAWHRWLGYGGCGSAASSVGQCPSVAPMAWIWRMRLCSIQCWAVSKRGADGLGMADMVRQCPGVAPMAWIWRMWLCSIQCWAVSKRGTYGLDMENVALQHPVLGSVQAWHLWLGYGGCGSAASSVGQCPSVAPMAWIWRMWLCSIQCWAVSKRGTDGLDMADAALQHPVLGSVQAWHRWLGYGGCGSAASSVGQCPSVAPMAWVWGIWFGSVQAWHQWLGYGGCGSAASSVGQCPSVAPMAWIWRMCLFSIQCWAVSRRGTYGLDMADVALQHPVLGSVQAWRRWLGYGSAASNEAVALQHTLMNCI